MRIIYAKRFYKIFFGRPFWFLKFFAPLSKPPPYDGERVWGRESYGACAPEKLGSNRKPPPPSRREPRPPSSPRRGHAGPQKDAKSRQLFRLLIISTTVNAIFCCICNSRSLICTTRAKIIVNHHNFYGLQFLPVPRFAPLIYALLCSPRRLRLPSAMNKRAAVTPPPLPAF